MPDNSWTGAAGAVAEVNPILIALTWATGDSFDVTINKKSLVITIGSLTTTAQVAQTILEGFNGSAFTDTTATVVPSGGGPDFIEHSELTATVSGSTVTLTADTAGVPWNITDGLTIAATTAGDGTAEITGPTAATGPNFIDNVDNWSAGTVLAAGEDGWVFNSSVPMLYALDALSAVGTLASLNFAMTFTADCGLPKTNASGYVEFRQQYLEVDATVLRIHGQGTGSGRIKIDGQAVQSAVEIENTGAAVEVGIGAFIWKGTSAANTLTTQNGSLSVAPFDGETAQVLTSRLNGGNVDFGDGATFPASATMEVLAADVSVRNSANHMKTVSVGSGTLTVFGSAAVDTSITITGGTVIWKSSGTIAAAVVGGATGGVLDFSQDNRARTVSAATLNANGTIIDPLRTVTWTGQITPGPDVEEINAT